MINKTENQLEQKVAGIHAVTSLIQKTGFFAEDKIYSARKKDDPRLQNFFYKAKRNSVSVERKTFAELDKLLEDKKHQGILLIRKNQIILNEISEQEIFQSFYKKKFLLYVVADSILDPANIGAMSRSMLAFDANGLVLAQKKSAPLGMSALKSSAGALSHLPIHSTRSLASFLQRAKEQQAYIIGSDTNGTHLRAAWTKGIVQMQRPVFLVMGSEEKGMSPSVEQLCDEIVAIPQSIKIQSLNVSVSTAILLQNFYVAKNSIE